MKIQNLTSYSNNKYLNNKLRLRQQNITTNSKVMFGNNNDEEKNKKRKQLIIGGSILLTAAAIAAAVWFSKGKKTTKATTSGILDNLPQSNPAQNNTVQIEKAKTDVKAQLAELDKILIEYNKQADSLRKKRDSEALTLKSEHIQELLEDYSGTNPEQAIINKQKDTKMLLDYMRRIDNMKQMNYGFERIYGYEKEKEYLRREFGIKKMALAKTSIGEKVDVPNAILFYGVTGTGKSTFALALAEQMGANIIKIGPDSFNDKNEAMAKILKAAKKSKEIYDKSGAEKQRSFIIIDEVNGLNLNEKFAEFLKDCSEKYKCTVFMTTNHPFDIPSNVLDAIPLTVGLELPDEENIRSFVKIFLERAKVEGDVNEITNTFLSLQKENFIRFANTHLEDILKNIMHQNKKITKKQIEYEFKTSARRFLLPSDLIKFYKEKLQFMQLNKELV